MIAAVVTVTLMKLQGFRALDGAVQGLSRPYALATLQRRPFGRSAPVLRSDDGSVADAIDFDAEPTFWFEPVPVDASENVTLELRVVDDHGDDAPTHPWACSIVISPPWTSGEQKWRDKQ